MDEGQPLFSSGRMTPERAARHAAAVEAAKNEHTLFSVKPRQWLIDDAAREIAKLKAKNDAPQIEDIVKDIGKAGGHIFQKIYDYFSGSTPEWATQLPPHMRPTVIQIHRLESIRKEFHIGQTEFLLHIGGHPEITRKYLMQMFVKNKFFNPTETERESLQKILLGRFMDGMQIGNEFFGLGSVVNDEIKLSMRLEEILNAYPSPDLLIQAIIDEEFRQDPSARSAAAGYGEPERLISEVLKEKTIDKAAQNHQVRDAATVTKSTKGQTDETKSYTIKKILFWGDDNEDTELAQNPVVRDRVLAEADHIEANPLHGLPPRLSNLTPDQLQLSPTSRAEIEDFRQTNLELARRVRARPDKYYVETLAEEQHAVGSESRKNGESDRPAVNATKPVATGDGTGKKVAVPVDNEKRTVKRETPAEKNETSKSRSNPGGIMRIALIVLNILLIVFMVATMIDASSNPDKDLEVRVLMFLLVVATCCLVAFLFGVDRWLGLYFKRKLLEERKKMDQLQAPTK